MSINAILTSSSNVTSTQSTTDSALSKLKQEKTALENQITQLQTTKSAANTKTIQSLQKQVTELDTQIQQAESSASSGQSTTTENTAKNSSTENFGAAYKTTLSKEGLNALEDQKNEKDQADKAADLKSSLDSLQ